MEIILLVVCVAFAGFVAGIAVDAQYGKHLVPVGQQRTPKKIPMPKEYLGNGVYAEFEGYSITLTTQNGNGATTNVVILEPETATELVDFIMFYNVLQWWLAK